MIIEVRTTPLKRYNSVLKINEPTLVLPDLHIPYHNGKWVNRCIKAARSLGATAVLLPGDAFDGNWASKYGDNSPERLVDEVRAWKEDVLPALRSSFEHIYVTIGNHEFRTTRATDFKIQTIEFVKGFFAADGVVFSEYHYAYVLDCWVGHPKGAGTTEHLKVARREGRNAILAHTHHWHVSQLEHGRGFAAQIGWCGDPEKMKYYRIDAPAPQAYVNGACVLKKENGVVVPYLMCDPWNPPEMYE